MPFSRNTDVIYADGPATSPNQPPKLDIRVVMKEIEGAIDAYASAPGSIARQTLAQLNADLTPAANTMAWVYADGANSGVYRKLGASGTGSWGRMLPLPYSFIIASDVGAGMPNAIAATTSVPVSSSSLVWLALSSTNTASPVTISFNGAAPLTIKANSGANVDVGGLVAGSIVLGIASGSTFRLLSDQAIAQSLYAARDAALAAQIAAESAAENAVAQGFVPIFDSPASAASFNLSHFQTLTVSRSADFRTIRPHRYSRVAQPGNIEPTVGPKFQSADGKWWALDERSARPEFFGAVGGGDDTAAVQAAINYVEARGSTLDVDGQWNVSKISIGSTNNFIQIVGNAVFTGVSTEAQTCLVEIMRGNYTVSGSVTAFCGYKYNYEVAIWVHHPTQLQSADLSKFIAVGAKRGTRFGDAANPGSVTSEISINMPRTYGCPVAFIIEGAQTYATIIAPCPISADGFGGDAAWNAMTKRAIVNIGANLTVIGGEIIQTASGLATDILIEMQPCKQGTVISYGRTVLNGVCLETGGPLARFTNPNGLTGTREPNDQPGLFLSACFGFHSQDNASLIAATTDYIGDIVIDEACNFWCPVARTQANITVGPLCHVYVADSSFGNGFRPALSGTVGGIVHFSHRCIEKFLGLPSANFVSGVNVLLWQGIQAAKDSGRFQPAYASGVFTVPTGGLKFLKLSAHCVASNVVGLISVQESLNGGTTWSDVTFGAFNTVGSVVGEFLEVVEGAKYRVILNASGGVPNPPSPLAYVNYLAIEAAN